MAAACSRPLLIIRPVPPPTGLERPYSMCSRLTYGDDTRFLDLSAGTGAIGIEAISRGAAFVTFIDRSKRSCALIEENLDKLDVPESATEVVQLSAETFAGRKHAGDGTSVLRSAV